MPLPATMRQIRFTVPGGPEVIALETAPLPTPDDGQILIKVAYAGVNRPDCLQRAGAYPPPPGAPEIPGLEVAGEIVALGQNVTGLVSGERITALVSGGGYAEYCLVDASLAMPLPRGLDLLEAAALPENVLTVYDNMITRGRLASGERFLVHGGASGIGSIAIQMAKAYGATVFATARGADKTAFCRALGADYAIDYASEDFVEIIARETGKKGVDVILDMVGGDYIARNLRSLALEGRLVQIAFLRSPVAEIDFRHVMVKRQTITGSTLRPRTLEQKSAVARAVIRDVWPLVEMGAIRPRIDTVFGLSQARAAHERMESNAHRGKIMLDMAG
ncbi:MAG: NAD(P)H-quinone oxidoreductase [Proteobacteria bacterium]|nr:NAD(P)H-quinone oxidoreductase [Pseudomonadota bacterium]